MQTVHNAGEYEGLHRQWQGKSIALVPTMGALHEGHAALIRRARKMADIVVVSIFVNPLQFGPNEDLDRYPRMPEQDMALCRELGVAAVFYPSFETLYPYGLEATTTVLPPAGMTDCLCGAYRPGHFMGVATVVAKLFNIIRPNMAIFGEKDAQQLAIIRRMTRELQMPVEIVSHPTVREADGLALSSRNRYLQTPEARASALFLSKTLTRVRDKAQTESRRMVRELLDEVSREVLDGMEAPVRDRIRLQYLEAVDKDTLAPVSHLAPGVLVAMAAYVDEVRLIDNTEIL